MNGAAQTPSRVGRRRRRRQRGTAQSSAGGTINASFRPTLPSDAPPCSTPSHFKIISYLRGRRAGSPTVKPFYTQRRPRRRLNPPYLLRLAIKSDYNIYISGAAAIIKLVCNAAAVIKVWMWLKVTHNE